MDWTGDITKEMEKHIAEMRQQALQMKKEMLRSCYFCGKDHGGDIHFQSKPVCYECNEKILQRIKLILKFE
jgi:hypothetical protein